MPGLVLTLPIAASKVEAWRRFCQELSGSRRQSYEASRRRLGITREQLALLESPFGSATATTLEAHDVRLALAELICSDLPFETWYRERLQDLHGVNLARYEQCALPAPHAIAQELLFEWTLTGCPGGVNSFRRDGALNKEPGRPSMTGSQREYLAGTVFARPPHF